MSIQATAWIPFKKRKEYPLMRDSWVELPEEDSDILVWEIGKDHQQPVWIASYRRKDLSEKEKLIVAVPGYTISEEADQFDVADDGFPFLAWLPIPDISEVLADADDFFIPPWWETKKEEVQKCFRDAWTDPHFWEKNSYEKED